MENSTCERHRKIRNISQKKKKKKTRTMSNIFVNSHWAHNKLSESACSLRSALRI